jgi:hypothetical protein
MKTALVSLLLALAAPALAGDPAPAKKGITLDFRLEPGQVHEECMKLKAGQGRKFEWTADKAVDFNVHYHKGDEAFYPFKANNRKAAKARFQAVHADDYCWMWTAQKEAVRVKGKINY